MLTADFRGHHIPTTPAMLFIQWELGWRGGCGARRPPPPSSLPQAAPELRGSSTCYSSKAERQLSHGGLAYFNPATVNTWPEASRTIVGLALHPPWAPSQPPPGIGRYLVRGPRLLSAVRRDCWSKSFIGPSRKCGVLGAGAKLEIRCQFLQQRFNKLNLSNPQVEYQTTRSYGLRSGMLSAAETIEYASSTSVSNLPFSLGRT
jgi:hypothetical protein